MSPPETWGRLGKAPGTDPRGDWKDMTVTSGTNVNAARCEALFASGLQRSDTPTLSDIRAAVERAERDLGECGCAASVAQEFGDHPETAIVRMQWARRLVEEAYLATGFAVA